MSQVSPTPEAGKSLPFNAISAQLSFLKGEILTIADATFSDKEQRKAFKDLVRDRFTSRLNHLAVLCEDGSVPCSAGSVQSRSPAEELERAGPEAWLSEIAPQVYRGTMAPFHLAFWKWLWPLLLAAKNGADLPDLQTHLAYLLTWARGLGTSTTVEWSHIVVGALLNEPLAMLISSSSKLASSHLQSIREEIEGSQVAKYYPSMACPQIGKFDNRFGWNGNLLATSTGGPIILAAGLEDDLVSNKIHRLRQSFVSIHDVDSRADKLSSVESKERLTAAVLAVQQPNTLIVMAGNPSRSESIIYRTLHHKNQLLLHRRESGHVRAFTSDLVIGTAGSRFGVLEGKPVWDHFDLKAFEQFLENAGSDQAYAEYQGL